jgi:hypothetical protein
MRTSSALAHLRAVVLAGALTFVAPAAAHAQATSLDVTRIAEQLGVALLEPGVGRRMTIGDAVTGTAEHPVLLQKIGVTGMHRGARVVVARVAADHVMVEVDELAPAPAKASVKLAIGPDGALRLP